jgi:predicted ATPase with chaperone activity
VRDRSGPLLDRIDVHMEVGRQRDGLPILVEERETSVDVIVEQLGLAHDAVRCRGGNCSTSLEEMVIEHLRSLPQDKQQRVSVPALASGHTTGLANLVDVL